MHSLLIFENYPLAPECSPLLLDSGTLPLFCFLLFLLCLVCCYKDPEVDVLSQDKDAVFCHLNSRREQGREDPTCETLVLSLPGTPHLTSSFSRGEQVQGTAGSAQFTQ